MPGRGHLTDDLKVALLCQCQHGLSPFKALPGPGQHLCNPARKRRFQRAHDQAFLCLA